MRYSHNRQSRSHIDQGTSSGRGCKAQGRRGGGGGFRFRSSRSRAKRKNTSLLEIRLRPLLPLRHPRHQQTLASQKRPRLLLPHLPLPPPHPAPIPPPPLHDGLTLPFDPRLRNFLPASTGDFRPCDDTCICALVVVGEWERERDIGG